MTCNFCGKVCKNINSLRNHERLCKLNPNREFTPPKSQAWYDSMSKRRGRGTNQFTKAKETGIPYIIKESTRKKISEISKMQVWSDERRLLHSIMMKNVVELHPESYTSSNRGRTKQIIFDGIKFQGSWELDYYKWSIENSIEIERCKEFFEYEWNGIRKYFPDFYLPKLDIYVEIKGYETERDRAKWSQFPKKLLIIRKKDIIDIRKKCFVRP